MQQYETVIVLTPLLSEDVAKEATAKFSKILTDNGAEIVQEDNWGLRKLAYPIQKKTTGYYHLTEYRAPGELINKLETEFRRDERVLRFLTIDQIQYVTAPKVEDNRKKYCRFKKNGIKYIDYKDANFLLKFVNDQGKVLPRRLTGTSLKFQRKVAQAVKRARHIGLLPYVADSLK